MQLGDIINMNIGNTVVSCAITGNEWQENTIAFQKPGEINQLFCKPLSTNPEINGYVKYTKQQFGWEQGKYPEGGRGWQSVPDGSALSCNPTAMRWLKCSISIGDERIWPRRWSRDRKIAFPVVQVNDRLYQSPRENPLSILFVKGSNAKCKILVVGKNNALACKSDIGNLHPPGVSKEPEPTYSEDVKRGPEPAPYERGKEFEEEMKREQEFEATRPSLIKQMAFDTIESCQIIVKNFLKTTEYASDEMKEQAQQDNEFCKNYLIGTSSVPLFKEWTR